MRIIVMVSIVLLTACMDSDDEVIINPAHDELLERQITDSLALARDKALMWNLIPIETQHDDGTSDFLVSPISAINAAARVFESVADELQGKSEEEVLGIIGYKESFNQGSYRFPFHPLSFGQKALVFRFDCGNVGWQFNLHLDEDNRVDRVERLFIH